MNAERTRREMLWLWLPVVGWMAAIFAFSSMSDVPSLSQGVMDLMLKKGGHAVGYSVLGFLLLRACRASVGQEQRGSLLPLLVAIVLGGLYAISDEIHQAFVPSRHPAIQDIALDLAAVTVTATLAWLWHRGVRRRD